MSGRPGATRQRLLLGALALLASVLVGWAVLEAASDPELFPDFGREIWHPGRALLEGESPLRNYATAGGSGTVYPPAATVLTLPYALVPYRIAAALWVLTLMAATVAALVICGVRDWRCLLLAGTCPPVVAGIANGNATALLLFALAAIWAWRDRPLRAGTILGVAVAGKLLLAPLFFWLVFTRRLRAAAAAAAVALTVSVLGAAVVGLERVDDFVDVSRQNVEDFAGRADSLVSLLVNLLDWSLEAATVAAALVASGALAIAWLSRRSDVASLTWALAAILLVSPIVWSHYFALLLVPIGLVAPTLSAMWLLPWVAAPSATPESGSLEAVVDPATGVALVLLVAVLVGARRSRARPAPAVKESAWQVDTLST